MSDTMNIRGTRKQLLTSVSAIALMMSLQGANAEDADRPTVWIELGWHYERPTGEADKFAPSFLSSFDPLPFTSPLAVQHLPEFGYGAEGRISLEPEGSDWTFSAAVRYGRARGHNESLQQKPGDPVLISFPGLGGLITITPQFPVHLNATVKNEESYTIADFTSGRDVGLGSFGSNGRSSLSLGLRFAQFKSSGKTSISGLPSFHTAYHFLKYGRHHNRYQANSQLDRRFQGLGPTISWDASALLLETDEDSGVSLDWGINAALLFGRQKVRGHHQTTTQYYKTGIIKYNGAPTFITGLYSQNGVRRDIDRSRTVMAPNLGGFAGLSARYSDAKLTLGYRADFFFGALDGGIDARHSTTRGFHGPFASISVGVGD